MRVDAREADIAMLQMLEWFPGGIEQEDGPEGVVLSGYAEQARPAGSSCRTSRPAGRRAGASSTVRYGSVSCGSVRRGRSRRRIAVVIDPGSAFGTGAHPSTRAALELLQRFTPQPVLDLGCGSGVLSIAALKLGFGPVAAFDLDPLAVSAAAEQRGIERGQLHRRAGGCAD